MPATTLYRGGRIYSPTHPRATALLVDGNQIVWLGTDEEAPAHADTVVDLEGALVTPGFVDAHVHATDTGISLLSLDLSDAQDATDVLDRVAAAARRLPADAVLLGHGWDESGWPHQRPPSAQELDRAAEGRRVYLAQASVHSAVVSSALMAAAENLPAAEGYDPQGWQRRDAHHVVRAIALSSLTASQRADAQRAALRRAASLGIVAVHECGGPEISSEADFTALLRLAATEPVPEVYGLWAELESAAKAVELGAVGAGGDLFVDGALGAQTAHLRQPYLDTDGCGYGYLTAEQVTAHLLDCDRHGVPGGFHAIGDQAISTVLEGFAAAAARIGVERLRAARHRIEHAEILDRDLIRGFVEYGIVASMQPAFDRLWGGTDGMYARRLGVERALASNPLGSLNGVGVPLAFGSDSPVTPLDPWGTVRAAMTHHNPVQRITLRAAFAAHTRGGWRSVGKDFEGVLAPGAPASFAIWDWDGDVIGGLPDLVPAGADQPEKEAPLPVCRRTVRRGTVIYDIEGEQTGG